MLYNTCPAESIVFYTSLYYLGNKYHLQAQKWPLNDFVGLVIDKITNMIFQELVYHEDNPPQVWNIRYKNALLMNLVNETSPIGIMNTTRRTPKRT